MVLLLGGSGYIGQNFQKALKARDLSFKNVSRAECDYTSVDGLNALVKEAQPSFLINCAGYTGKPNVDACEVHRAECLSGNAVLPGTIREVCESHGVSWGHVSSGCIYTGRREDGAAFTEEDAPNFTFRQNNCSFYSGTKALGEEVLEGAENCYIWRLRIPFDHRDSPRNYLSKLMNYQTLLEAENSISHLGDFVSACIDCHQQEVPFGKYNVTNTGSVTTREVTELIQQYLMPEKEFEFFENEESFMQLAAKTPRSNCAMDNAKLRDAGVQIRDVEEAIVQSLQNWQTQ